MTTCPTCRAPVVVGELRRDGHAFFACFEAADVASAYLMLPTPSWRLAPRFVASSFGNYALHGCGVSLAGGVPVGWPTIAN
jgi:hypothetical protein